MASQYMIDLYQCDEIVLNDLNMIKQIAREAVSRIGASIVEECCHKFEPIGVTYIAVITTSHFSIHTWPENGYVAIDVFSCKENVPSELTGELANAFGAKKVSVHSFERRIEE